MPGLSPKQSMVIRTLIDTAPDKALRSLDMALSSEHVEGAMAQIRDMVALEASDRRTRALVFLPFAPLCPRTPPRSPHKTFSHQGFVQLWRGVKQAAPDQASLAEVATLNWSDETDPPQVFDELCAMAARGLREPAGTPFALAAAAFDAAEPGGSQLFATYLDLAGLARPSIAKMPEWLGRMNEDMAVTIRLAFKDATAIAPDSGPKFFEILCAQLAEPWQILRIISATMDRPGDSYMAASELGHIGERLLADIERSMIAASTFDPWGGEPAGRDAANSVAAAVALITEFEHAVDLAKDGPWGTTIFKHKRNLAQSVEKMLGKADDAVAAALPLKAARFGKGRGMPRYDAAPDARALARAQGMLTFVSQTRGPAQAGGYASYRAKVIEKLDDRVDHYIEDVLDHLRDEEGGDHERAAEFLEIAANLVGLFRDDKAAAIVRRRAAA